MIEHFFCAVIVGWDYCCSVSNIHRISWILDFLHFWALRFRNLVGFSCWCSNLCLYYVTFQAQLVVVHVDLISRCGPYWFLGLGTYVQEFEHIDYGNFLGVTKATCWRCKGPCVILESSGVQGSDNFEGCLTLNENFTLFLYFEGFFIILIIHFLWVAFIVMGYYWKSAIKFLLINFITFIVDSIFWDIQPIFIN